MGPLDVKTIFVLFALGNLFTLFFFSLYILLYRIKKKNLYAYVTGKVFQEVTWVFFIFRDSLPGEFAIATANICLLFGLGYELYAMVMANQEFNRHKFIAINTTALVFSLIFLGVLGSKESTRVAIMSFFTCFIIFSGAIEILRNKKKAKMQHVAGILATVIGISFFARSMHAIFFQDSASLYGHSLIQLFAYTALFMITYSWPIIFMFLIKEQDEVIILEHKKRIESDNQTLKAANATKDKLFSIIAHDLRSPYNAILGFTDLMADANDSPNADETRYFNRLIRKSVRQSFILLNNLLQWSRIQTGAIKIKPALVNLNELVEDTVRLMRVNLEEKKIQVKVNVQKEYHLVADRLMLDTVIRNLVSNAIKFSKPNSVVEISITQRTHYNVIEVRDYGVGISEADISKLFHIESNYTKNGTNNEKGTGLGLVLCKEFIDAQGGEIWVESKLYEGTSFFFSLPTKPKKNDKLEV